MKIVAKVHYNSARTNGGRDVFIPTTKPNYTWFVLLCYSYCKGICCGCHTEAWHTTVQTELKRISCGSEVAKKGISCYDASADSCLWNVRGTCCRGKEDCRHASVHGLQDLLYFWKLCRSDRIPCINTSLAQCFSCVQIIFCTSQT